MFRSIRKNCQAFGRQLFKSFFHLHLNSYRIFNLPDRLVRKAKNILLLGASSKHSFKFLSLIPRTDLFPHILLIKSHHGRCSMRMCMACGCAWAEALMRFMIHSVSRDAEALMCFTRHRASWQDETQCAQLLISQFVGGQLKSHNVGDQFKSQSKTHHSNQGSGGEKENYFFSAR